MAKIFGIIQYTGALALVVVLIVCGVLNPEGHSTLIIPIGMIIYLFTQGLTITQQRDPIDRFVDMATSVLPFITAMVFIVVNYAGIIHLTEFVKNIMISGFTVAVYDIIINQMILNINIFGRHN
jgi:hypothetical protein